MVDRVIPDYAQGADIPGQWSENWPDNSNALLTGHEPAVLTTDEVAPASVTWPALSPVTLASGVLALAAPGTPAIGVTITAVTHGAGDGGKKVPVYRAGCFNPDLIVWPAAFDTFEKKRAAFEGAPNPTHIVIRPVQGYTDTPPFAP